MNSKISNIKHKALLIFIAILIILFFKSAFAFEKGDKMIHFWVEEIGENPYFYITDMKVILFNDYYSSLEVYDNTGEAFETFPDEVRLVDSNGNTLLSNEIDWRGFFPYSEEGTELVFLKEGQELYRQAISFCDNDGICEPCNSPNCNTAENNLICGDCASGSLDGYCDLAMDGVCDEDCELTDADCEECDTCQYYEEDVGETCESKYDGEICDVNEFCSGKEVVSLYSERCCIEGSCRDVGEPPVVTFEDVEIIYAIDGTPINKTRFDEILEDDEITAEEMTYKELVVEIEEEPAEPGEVIPEEEPFITEFKNDTFVAEEAPSYFWPAMIIIIIIVVILVILLIRRRGAAPQQPPQQPYQ